MNWGILIIAGLFEIGFAACLSQYKISVGVNAILWLGGFFACLILSMLLLFKASQTLPMGTAYAVWTGIGAAGTVMVGILLFDEPATFWRILFLCTLIGSVVGLKIMT